MVLPRESFGVFGAEVIASISKLEPAAHFGVDIAELVDEVLRVAPLSPCFCYICTDRSRGSPDLIRQRVPLLLRPALRLFKNLYCCLKRSAVNPQFVKSFDHLPYGKEQHSPFTPHTSHTPQTHLLITASSKFMIVLATTVIAAASAGSNCGSRGCSPTAKRSSAASGSASNVARSAA